MVGEGGYKEWNDLMPQVIPAVQSLRNLYPNYSIYVTGHSLGGIFLSLNQSSLKYSLFIYFIINSGDISIMRIRISRRRIYKRECLQLWVPASRESSVCFLL